jgi:MarR family transcriptional regulator, organic hydroperoxide resistance regulator
MSSEHTMEDWELLAQVSQAYRTLSDDFMEQIGMHRAQATLLCRLYRNEGMTQSEIADRLSVQGATVTSILQRLEEAGLIRRRRDPADNRLVRVYLTDAGRQKERAITEQFLQLEDAMFAGISDEERALARRLLQQILRNMAART